MIQGYLSVHRDSTVPLDLGIALQWNVLKVISVRLVLINPHAVQQVSHLYEDEHEELILLLENS